MKHVLEFDGGTPCNIPSRGYEDGYGSFQINGLPIARNQYGRPMSANTAEVLTMHYGLEEIFRIFGRSSVLVRGDSKIALGWVEKSRAGKMKFSKGSSQEYISAVILLHNSIQMHLSVQSEWRCRDYSVTIFGH